MDHKILKKYSIKEDATITEALQRMDRLNSKLLIVAKGMKFVSLLSIGDIQRAIIKNCSTDTVINKILRPSVTVAYKEDSYEKITKKILSSRIEYMPIIDHDNTICNIIFWDEVFKDKPVEEKETIDLPVVIMAGGKGTRLKPITNIIPKPLIPVGEKPIIDTIISQFTTIGAHRFYVSVNYKSKMIRDYFEDNKSDAYSVQFIEETKPLGTAGSLFLLQGQVSETFFITNCDILVKQNYVDVYNYHRQNNNEITMVASLKHLKIPYGTLETGEDGLLMSMMEKPELTYMINTGMYLLEPHIIDEIPENTFMPITNLIENVRKRNGRVGVFPVSEKSWFDIGEWSEYQNTLKEFERRF